MVYSSVAMMPKKGSYDAEKGHNGDFNPPKDWFMDKQGPLFVEYRKKVQDTDANAVEAIGTVSRRTSRSGNWVERLEVR